MGEEIYPATLPVTYPGDPVLLTSKVAIGAPEQIHAVRHRARIVLSRILLKADSMLLLPPDGASDFEIVPVAGRREALKRLAGTVVLMVRGWG